MALDHDEVDMSTSADLALQRPAALAQLTLVSGRLILIL